MRKSITVLVTAFLISVINVSIAKSYEFSHGYIFEQKYVKRISIGQAERILSSPGLFAPLMSWNWGSEKIADPMVKRVGDTLFFEFAGKERFSFRDYVRKTSDAVEGDSQQFIYLKSTTTHHVMGVVFGHDQPAFLLVSKTGRRLYFVNTN